ncbi:hypothetical protein C7271_15410 [filamentous cyanobacterium CCP5]|nr:hypothetical protein C7271_15410 [filamentous cyanobacterium CCP5]
MIPMTSQSALHQPPMKSSDEATSEQLDLAKQQGQALQKALDHMVQKVAYDAGEQPAGEYLMAYAVEEAEGMHQLQGGELVWNPRSRRTSMWKWPCAMGLTVAIKMGQN